MVFLRISTHQDFYTWRSANSKLNHQNSLKCPIHNSWHSTWIQSATNIREELLDMNHGIYIAKVRTVLKSNQPWGGWWACSCWNSYHDSENAGNGLEGSLSLTMPLALCGRLGEFSMVLDSWNQAMLLDVSCPWSSTLITHNTKQSRFIQKAPSWVPPGRKSTLFSKLGPSLVHRLSNGSL